MMKIIAAIIAATPLFYAISTPASANCYGTESSYRCSDSSGNNYRVNKSGGTTRMTGMNSSGEMWTQNSTTIGNATRTTGFDKDGNYWSSNTTVIGDATRTTGFDSDGNYFSTTCRNGKCTNY